MGSGWEVGAWTPWPQFYLVGPLLLIPMGRLLYWPEGGALPPLMFWPQMDKVPFP